MNQEVLTLAPGGHALAQSLGFAAAAVTVDNLTSSYVTLTDVGKVVPPWIYGAVVPLPPGLTRASAKLTATTPAIPGPPVPVTQVTLIWTDVPLPADPGHLLQQVTTQQQNVQTTITATAGNSTTDQNIPIPAGTLAIGFGVYGGGSLSTAGSVNFTGDQTGIDYFLGAVASNSDGVQSVPFDATDTSITVKLDQTGKAAPAKIDVLAWPVVPVVTVKQNQGDLPIGVFLERSDGVAIDVDAGVAGGSLRLGTSLEGAAPAPWQASPFSKEIDANEVVGTRFQIVAGSPGVTIYVHEVSFGSNAAAKVDLEDGSGGTVIGRMFYPAAAAPIHVHDFKGRKLTTGNGLFGNLAVGGTEVVLNTSYNLG